jgi:hypothetical protein
VRNNLSSPSLIEHATPILSDEQWGGERDSLTCIRTERGESEERPLFHNKLYHTCNIELNLRTAAAERKENYD